MDNLHQAATRADDYALTHRNSFNRPVARSNPVNKTSGTGKRDHRSGTGPQNPYDRGTPRLPLGPTCYYCKRRGHVKAECPALERKDGKTRSNSVVAPHKLEDSSVEAESMKVPVEYEPFVSRETISLLAQWERIQ